MKPYKQENWYYPPTRTRRGTTRHATDIKTVFWFKSNLFAQPTILISDLHSHTQAVVERLADTLDLSQYSVITAGDMAGDNVYGSDGDPTPTYAFLRDRAKALYIVQGNHDLPSPALQRLRNGHHQPCLLPDGVDAINTTLGKLGGVQGTISNKQHPYKKTAEDFYDRLERLLRTRPAILVTHETPALPGAIGKDKLFDMVKRYTPRIHIFGHCHHREPIQQIGGTTFLNVDARVMIFDLDDDANAT